MLRGQHPIKLPVEGFVDAFFKKVGKDLGAWRKTLSRAATREHDKGNGVAGLRILHAIGKSKMSSALK